MSKLCRNVVAIDGGYFLFPGAIDQPRSHPQQADVILRTAEALGMGVTVISPNEPWESEVEKNAMLFQTAQARLTADDWILWLGADEVVSDAGDISELEKQPADVAEVMMWERQYTGRYAIRRCFRALPNITVEYAHYFVTAEKDGKRVILSGSPRDADIGSAFMWSGTRIEHRAEERDAIRYEKKQRYAELALPREAAALREAFPKELTNNGEVFRDSSTILVQNLG
jgi:hypothetical protein